jgi:choline-sulfatase
MNSSDRPNILFVMTDQQRFDTIAALGNERIYTPNLDRLVQRGVSFQNAYTPCPVCIPARYVIRTGCSPLSTGIFSNGDAQKLKRSSESVEGRTGAYLARTMRALGYRTFGIGKSHTVPVSEELGFEVHLRSEETWATPEERRQDAYARWIESEHPEFGHVEQLHGERTEMYYMPQVSPLPAELTVEAWAADRAVEQILADPGRPYFGLVSFVGPHPPFAPPIPFNRIYDPDSLPPPYRGDPAVDRMDEQIRRGNYAVWAEDIGDRLARVLKSRYYGEITFIDHCIGRILDVVETSPNADNTLICFFSDHGDHLGDHGAWQKQTFFEGACRVPFLLSWPRFLPGDVRRSELVSLVDLFGIATTAAGQPELRGGIDVLGMLEGRSSAREYLMGYFGEPGTNRFKTMVRWRGWKYVFMANGGREQLFDLDLDPRELSEVSADKRDLVAHLRQVAADSLKTRAGSAALDGNDLKAFPFVPFQLRRIQQMDASRGIRGFPRHPREVVDLLVRQGAESNG